MARRFRLPERRSPGGVGDGLPALPDGEPLLHRWFAVAMVLLSIVAVVLTVLVFTTRIAPPDTELPPASRRPIGTDAITHERGEIVLADSLDVEDGVACAPNVRLVGDLGGRATARRALTELCRQVRLAPAAMDPAAVGLIALNDQGGIIRIALGAATGVDSSARVEQGVVVVELAPKFQFADGRTAAPSLAHELTHMAGGAWPGAAVDAEAELLALEVQAVSCDLLQVDEELPRGCGDAAGVLADPDPLAALRLAGYTG